MTHWWSYHKKHTELECCHCKRPDYSDNLRLLHSAQQRLINSLFYNSAYFSGEQRLLVTDEFLHYCGRPLSFILSMTRIEANPLFYVSFRYGLPNMVAASSHLQPQVHLESSILFSKQVTKATSVKRHKATFLPRRGNVLGQRSLCIFSKCWLRSPCILGRA